MRTIIFLCLVSLSVQDKIDNPIEVSTNESVPETSLNPKEICMIKANITSDNIEELNYIYEDPVLMEAFPEYLDYLYCYWKIKKLLFEDGEINYTELEKAVDYTVKLTIDASDVPLLNTWIIASDIVEQCKNVEGSTHGEKAVKLRNCMYGKLLKRRNVEIEWSELEDIPNLDLTEEDCVNELNLDGLAIEDINRHYMVPNNRTDFSDFLACYWKKIDIMDKNGNFNVTALQLKLDESIEFEVLSRSRAVYLSDIITESILNGCRKIKANNNDELILRVQNYILWRLPFFKIVI